MLYVDYISSIRPLMERTARSILHNEADCADAVQEALLKGWMHYQDLRETKNFRAWQLRILVNECYNLQRRMQRMRHLEIDYASSIPKTSNPYWFLEYKDLINSIPLNRRICLKCYCFHGYTIEEIATFLGISKNAVKLRLHHGRRQLLRNIDNQ